MMNRGEKNQETEKDKMPRHEKHPPFRWVSIWGIFYCETGDLLRFSDPSVHQEGLEPKKNTMA